MLPLTTMVRPYTKIQRPRLLPRYGMVMVAGREQVTPEQVIGKAPAVSGYMILDAADEYGLSADRLKKNLLVREGDEIDEGAPLISIPSRVDKSKAINSPVDGVFVRLDDVRLIIHQANKLIEIRALAHGQVSTIIPGRGAVLEIFGSQLQAIWDSGREGFGQLTMGTDSAFEELDQMALQGEFQRQIVAAGTIRQAGILEALEDNGIRGLIVGSILPSLCSVANQVAYPVFVTDGLGSQNMSPAFFDLLKNSIDREVSLYSSANGNSSRQRAEIIISDPEPDPNQRNIKAISWKPLEIGDTIRIVTADTSQLGSVIELQEEPQRVSSGAWTTGAQVKFSDGAVDFVPYASIDMII